MQFLVFLVGDNSTKEPHVKFCLLNWSLFLNFLKSQIFFFVIEEVNPVKEVNFLRIGLELFSLRQFDFNDFDLG